jgi:hypothetical protein
MMLLSKRAYWEQLPSTYPSEIYGLVTLGHSKSIISVMNPGDPGPINNDKYSKTDMVLDRIVRFIISSRLLFVFHFPAHRASTNTFYHDAIR